MQNSYSLLEPITSNGQNITSIDIQAGGLSAYLETIFEYLLIVVTVIAIFMLIYGGIEYLTTDIASKKSGGKETIIRSITGLIFVFCVWFILNLINPDLTNTTLRITSNVVGRVSGGGSIVTTPPENINNGEYPWPTGNVMGTGVTCNGGKLTRQWSTAACSDNYKSIILAASNKYGVDKNIIRAVIYQESNGNPNAVSAAGARGLMQITPGTAAGLGCQTGWETDPEKNIDCGTKYLSQNKNQSTYNLYAGYNGGYGTNALGQSSSCGGGLLRWQCAFDNSEHTVCNTGFEESRNYAVSTDFWKKKLDNNNCSW